MFRLHEPPTYIFDEVYHASTAKLIARNDPRAYEWWNPAPEPNTAVDWLHPPLAKYTQALSILAFGENSFGWRFSSVVFGVLVILMVYHLAYKLFDNHIIALLSAALASFDGLLLVQSRIAMNDIHVTFFILLTLYNYLRFRESQKLSHLFFTGLTAGLAMATKWSGLFVLATVLVFEGLQLIAHCFEQHKSKTARWLIVLQKFGTFLITRVPLLIILPLIVYVAGYSHMFLQGKGYAHFKELHKQIWWYQTHLDAHHPYESRPIDWFFNLRPVWVHVTYGPDGTTRSDIYAFGNPVLFWTGCVLFFFTLIFFVTQPKKYLLQSSKEKIRGKGFLPAYRAIINHPLIFLVASYCMVWMPWQLSPRIMFFYHYTPAVPLLSILIAYWMYFWADHAKPIIYAFFACILIAFFVWYPHWIGIEMPTSFVENVYFALPQWK
jgi:dolichyl-phosphate-mannose--protein O-mannosyl transferase